MDLLLAKRQAEIEAMMDANPFPGRKFEVLPYDPPSNLGDVHIPPPKETVFIQKMIDEAELRGHRQGFAAGFVFAFASATILHLLLRFL